jgi:hypothetical protein
MLLTSLISCRSNRSWPLGGFAIAFVALIAVLARMFSPFLIAPGVAATGLAWFAMNPLARSRIITAIVVFGMIAAILGAWCAEALGWLAPTTKDEGGYLMIRSPLDGIDAFPTLPSLCIYVVLLLILTTVYSAVVMIRARSSRDQLDLYAWHLRQLLSR